MRRWLGRMALLVLVFVPGGAGAWPWCDGPGCPRPSYSPFHILTPEVDRLRAWCRKTTYTYPCDLHPEMPLHFESVKYPCRPVPPAVYTGNYPWSPPDPVVVHP